MLRRFVPPKAIRKIQRDCSLPPEQIRQSQFEEVREKFDRISTADPLVSVVIIAYNEEENLFKTLASLAETRCKYPIEFIVANNNSKDRTQEIIDKCGVRSVFEERQGYPFARQAGHNIARGKYVISGDADTLYTSGWAQALVDPLVRDEQVVCTYGLHAFYAENDKYPLSMLIYQYAKTLGVYFRNYKRPQLNCGGASMAYSVEAANKVGGYNLNMVRGTDGYLAYELMSHGKIELVSDRGAMIYTSMRRTAKDGTLSRAFWIRSKRYFRNLFRYLTPQNDD